MNWRPLTFSISLTLAILIYCQPVEAAILDRIVANVNGEIITLRDLNAEVEQRARTAEGASSSDSGSIQRDTLEKMVEETLTRQQAKKLGIVISDNELNAAIDKIKIDNNLNDAEFIASLREQGYSIEYFRETLRMDLMKARIINQEVRAAVVVSDEEVEAYLRMNNPDAMEAEPEPEPAEDDGKRAHVRNISITVPAEATEEEIEQKMELAEKLRKKLERGADFEELAAEYSDGMNEVMGGDLGVVSFKDLDRRIRAAMEKLKPGKVSKPVKAGEAIHIFQVVEIVENDEAKEKNDNKEEVQSQFSAEDMERARKILTDRRLKDKYEEWIRSLKDSAIIQINL